MTREKALVFLSQAEKEISLLDRTVDVIEKRLKGLRSITDSDDFSAYIESLALNLHSFYEGIEAIFDKVLEFTGEDKPSGHEWHLELIERMAMPIRQLRPEVISEQTVKNLDTYRAFRHKVRHIYGFMLVPENIITIAEKMKDNHEEFKRDFGKFMAFVEELIKLSE